MSSQDNPVLGSIALMVGGLLVFVMGFKLLKKKRLVENIPTSKIRSMAMGQVEIQGQAVDCQCFTAPFTQNRCVYYSYRVEKWVQGNKRNYWKTIHHDDTRLAPFYLSDETGKAIIYPDGAEFSLPEDFSLTTDLFTNIPSHIVEFLDARGVSYKNLLGGNKKLRFRETYIGPGEGVYVLGVCQDNRMNVKANFQNTLGKAVQKVKNNPELLKKYDRNADGDLSPFEWELAVRQIEDEVRESPVEDEEKVFVGRGQGKDQFFLISDRGERSLLTRLKWQSIGAIYGGAIFFLLGLWLFLTEGLKYLGYSL